MTYVIHGATGAQGAPVVSALTAAGKPVAALTRNADAVVPGARVVAAGYSSTEELTATYRNAAGVFVHLPVSSEEDRRTYARNIVAALPRPARPVWCSPPVVSPSTPSRVVMPTVRSRHWSAGWPTARCPTR